MTRNKRHGCYRLAIWVNVLLGLAVAFYRLPELGSLAVIAGLLHIGMGYLVIQLVYWVISGFKKKRRLAMKERWQIEQNQRELAIAESNRTHPLNQAVSDQLAKLGALPPFLYVLVLIQYGIDERSKKADVAPYWVVCVEDLLYEMEDWMPDRVMWYLTHYLEEDYPTDAVDLVQQVQTPLDAAMELMEIVKQNLVVSGVEIDPPTPWR